MVDAPIRMDARLLQVFVVLEQVVERAIGVGHVIDPDEAVPFVVRAVRVQRVQVGQGESMMFVVVAQEGERRVLVVDPGIEHLLIPRQHLVETTGPVDDVRELLWTDSCHVCSPFFCFRHEAVGQEYIR